MPERAWTQSMKIAEPYAQFAVRQGLTSGLGMEMYRAGGGEIATEAWGYLYRKAAVDLGVWKQIEDIPIGFKIEEDWFSVKPYDFAEEFHFGATVRYFDKELQSWEEKVVSVNLAETTTKIRWQKEMEDALRRTEESPQIDWDRGVTFYDFFAERRA